MAHIFSFGEYESYNRLKYDKYWYICNSQFKPISAWNLHSIIAYQLLVQC